LEGKAKAFGMGGCGCLLAFAVLGILAVIIGGNVRIDPGGAICLFIAGGIVGLIVLAIYNKGKSDGGAPRPAG
jgi:hypothetical protein